MQLSCSGSDFDISTLLLKDYQNYSRDFGRCLINSDLELSSSLTA